MASSDSTTPGKRSRPRIVVPGIVGQSPKERAIGGVGISALLRSSRPSRGGRIGVTAASASRFGTGGRGASSMRTDRAGSSQPRDGDHSGGVMVRTCSVCGAANRIPGARLHEIGRCGRCKTTLGPSSTPIDIADPLMFDELVREAKVPILIDFWAAWVWPVSDGRPGGRARRQRAGRARARGQDRHTEVARARGPLPRARHSELRRDPRRSRRAAASRCDAGR